MTVAVMNVWHVSVCVFHLMMPMPMRVGLLRRQVLDTVVYVMAVGVMMTVFVLNGLVRVQVLVALREVQPDAQRHERAGDQQPRADRFTQKRNRQHRARTD